MNTSFHVYDKDSTPVSDLINLDEEQLIKKIKERVNKYDELTIVKVEEDDYDEASY
mgnify:CR=1 FL=1|tara:strand:+ start:266 stop:433 length:168 start_codon:yes stop_codon:yes gene_type:complete